MYIMTLSGQLGDLMGLGITPFIVRSYEYIPRMNIIWFVPAAAGFGICVLKVCYK